MELRGKKVTLRPWRPSDALRLKELVGDRSVARWTTVPYPYTLRHARAFIAKTRCTLRQQRPETLAFAILDRTSGRPIGCVGAHEIDHDTKRCEIGYWMGAAYRGNGFTSAACRLLIRYLRKQWRMSQVGVKCALQNYPSQRIAKAIGGRYVGLAKERSYRSGLGRRYRLKHYLIGK